MLVISRKNGQKIMINDNIVITIVDARNGQVKIAIDADKDVKIYREEIYYQIKLANLIGKNTDVDAVNSISGMLKDEKIKINDKIDTTQEAGDFIVEDDASSQSFTIKKSINDNKD